MNFDFQLLGRKFKMARETLLIDVGEVSSDLGISVKEYQDIEDGRKQVTGDTVVKLAQIFRRDFRYFVTNDEISVDSQIHEMYRQNAKITRRDRIVIQDFIRLCETKWEFENLLGISRLNTLDYRSKFSSGGYFKGQGELMACEERTRLRISDNVENIYSLVRQQNVHVFRRELEDDTLSGLYLHHPVVGHCILINYNDDVFRQNFSLAHEYAHVLADSQEGQSVTWKGEHDLREVRANTFASYFLLPSDATRFLQSPGNIPLLSQNVSWISRHYGISSDVILIRLLELKLITKEQKRQLERSHQLKVPVGERVDPELKDVSNNYKDRMLTFIKRGLSVQYVNLCSQVYREGLVSFGKIIEALQVSYEEGQNLMSMWVTFMEV